jgi:hypothetical protein
MNVLPGHEGSAGCDAVGVEPLLRGQNLTPVLCLLLVYFRLLGGPEPKRFLKLFDYLLPVRWVKGWGS